MKPATSSSPNLPYGRISLFFALIYVALIWGFYKTYIIFFPSFTGFQFVQHFHGAMMGTWMLILIVQPLLIRAGKQSIHNFIGKLTFVIAPLVAISIFLMSKFSYYKPEPSVPHNEKVGMIALSMPAFAAFVIFYVLAIINRRNTYNHMRYMIGTSLLMIGPGLGRALIIYYHKTLPEAVSLESYLTIGIATAFLLSDVIRKKSFKANAIILGVILSYFLLWEFRLYQPWQSIGEFIAAHLF